MPKIVEYTSTGELRPQDRGIDAFVRAGRYVGQYYRQSSHDTAEAGQLQGREIRERAWPFDILALEQQAQETTRSRGGGGGGGGGSSGGSGGGGGGGAAAHYPHASTSRGAAALGRVASALGDSAGRPYGGSERGSRGPEQVYNPDTGAASNWASQVAKQQAEQDKAYQRNLALEMRHQDAEYAQLQAYNKGLTADAQKAAEAQQLDNWYKTGNLSVPTGVDANSGFDTNGNPINAAVPNWSPANDPAQDSSFAGYVAGKLEDWASSAGSAISDYFTSGGSNSAPMSSGDPTATSANADMAPDTSSGVMY